MLDLDNIVISDTVRLDMNELIELGKTKLRISERVKLYQIIIKENRLGGIREFIKSGEPTRETLARLAGFSSYYIAYYAEVVVKQGTPQLIARMDLRGENKNKNGVSIKSAVTISKQKPEEQNRILNMSKYDIRDWVRANKVSPAKVQKTKRIDPVQKTKRIDPPYVPLTLPSSAEIEEPPPSATWAERAAWRDKVGSKVVLHPLRIKQLQTDESGTNQLMTSLKVILRNDTPTAEEFADSIARMLLHVHKPDAYEPGDRKNYASAARNTQAWVKKNIDLAINKLEAYREMCRGY